jgi:hypothetical protein
LKPRNTPLPSPPPLSRSRPRPRPRPRSLDKSSSATGEQLDVLAGLCACVCFKGGPQCALCLVSCSSGCRRSCCDALLLCSERTHAGAAPKYPEEARNSNLPQLLRHADILEISSHSGQKQRTTFPSFKAAKSQHSEPTNPLTLSSFGWGM